MDDVGAKACLTGLNNEEYKFGGYYTACTTATGDQIKTSFSFVRLCFLSHSGILQSH